MIRQRPSRKQPAFTLFFPAAAMHAVLVIPLSVHAMTSVTGWPSALLGIGHGREMLFGFVPALIAGYTLGPMRFQPLISLLALWLSARIAYLVIPGSLLTELLNALFLVALAIQIVPKFKTAKKWRNRILSPLLLSICVVPIIYSLTYPKWINAHTLFIQAILLFALLMAFVGGRMLAAAAGAESERQGLILESRVQPLLEWLMILLLPAAVVIFGISDRVAAMLCIITGILLLIRLLRWRLWRCRYRLDTMGMGLGYIWLAAGLVSVGMAHLSFYGGYTTAAIHMLTIGALGNLSTGVMVRQYAQHWRRAAPPSFTLTALFCINLAAFIRLIAIIDSGQRALWLWTAAGSWSVAYCTMALLYFRANASK